MGATPDDVLDHHGVTTLDDRSQVEDPHLVVIAAADAAPADIAPVVRTTHVEGIEGIEDIEDIEDDIDDGIDDDIAFDVALGPIAGADLEVASSGIHGAGVFASRPFAADELIERCPVLVLDADEATRIADTMLTDYVYEWHDGAAVALGFGSLYNHSRRPNARYEMDYDNDEIHVVALGTITEGDEILINYNGDPTVQTPVWFEE